MLEGGYRIDISTCKVSIRSDSSDTPLDLKVTFGILAIGFAVLMFTVEVFGPGRHNRPSVWENLHSTAKSSPAHGSALLMMTISAVLWGFVLLCVVRHFFSDGEELSCDSSNLTLAKIPLYSLRGKWVAERFSISQIKNFRYAIITQVKGRSFYGFRFTANGNNKKIFKGLEPPEALKVMTALKQLGLNVEDDPDLPAKVQQTLSTRIDDPYRSGYQ